MTHTEDGLQGAAGHLGRQSTSDLECGRTLDDAAAGSGNAGALGPERNGKSLDHISTHVSLGPDNPVEPYPSLMEVPDSAYETFPAYRKVVIVTLLSFCSLLSPISSTSILAATPEVASEYGTDGSIVDVANAIYMLVMGISPVVWGPLSEVYGRRVVC
jgi:hypothetical protein